MSILNFVIFLCQEGITAGEIYHYAEPFLTEGDSETTESGAWFAHLRHERILNEQYRVQGHSSSPNLAPGQVLETEQVAGSLEQDTRVTLSDIVVTCNKLMMNDAFSFESSTIFQSKIYSFGWGLWHDPDSSRKGTSKNQEKALQGDKQSRTLIMESPFPDSQKKKKTYGIEYGELLNHINDRIVRLESD